MDSAPIAKVDRRKLLQYTYLLQEDASKDEENEIQDNESMHSEHSNKDISQNQSLNQLEDEFMSMESASFQDEEDDSQGQITQTQFNEEDASTDPEKMQMLKANSKISKSKVADSEALPTYLKGCNDFQQQNGSKKKAFVEESKSHRGDDELEYPAGNSFPGRKNSAQILDSGNKSEQQGQNKPGSNMDDRSNSSSEMLAVNDPQNFYYAYDPEERRMKIVSESASEARENQQPKQEEPQ